MLKSMNLSLIADKMSLCVVMDTASLTCQCFDVRKDCPDASDENMISIQTNVNTHIGIKLNEEGATIFNRSL